MKSLVFALGALLAAASHAMAQTQIDGIIPGMSRDQMVSLLSQYGEVKSTNVGTGIAYYVGNMDTNVSMCPDGLVVSAITRNIGSSFASFARTAQLTEAKRGKGSFELDGREGEPAFYYIRETWTDASGTQYSVSYTSIGISDGNSSESVWRKCY